MKKFLYTLLIALAVGTTESQAQSLDDLMKSISSFLGTTSEQQKPATPAETHPAADKLMGRWVYDAPTIDYKGDSSLAAIAVSTLESQLPLLVERFDFVAGRDSISVGEDGIITIAYGENKVAINCTNYNPTTGVATLQMRVGEQPISIGATVIDHSGKVKMMFNAKELMDLVAKHYSKYNEMITLQMAKSVIDSYPGIRMGVILRR